MDQVSTALLGFSESSMPILAAAALFFMLFGDAIFRPRDSFTSETHRKSPNNENPDTTWQTPLLLLESKSLLEQNCYRLAASH